MPELKVGSMVRSGDAFGRVLKIEHSPVVQGRSSQELIYVHWLIGRNDDDDRP
jgi:hypothetical protein